MTGSEAPPVPGTRLLSKSDYKVARTCEAKLYFRENRYPDVLGGDMYLQMLAQGGYMVEALAKAHYPDGVSLEYAGDPQRAFDATLDQLSRDNVTLFEATLLWNRRLARADIIQKSGNTIRLFEVKAKSFDSKEHEASLVRGEAGCFRGKKKPHGILSTWTEKFEGVAYQVLLLERLFPGFVIEPHLILVDKSKRAQIDDIPSLFEIVRRTIPGGASRVHTAHFTGDQALLPQLDLLTTVNVAAEVALVRDEVEEAAAAFELLLDAPLSDFHSSHGSKCKDCEFKTEDNVELSGFRDCWGELAHTKPHILELFSVGTVKSEEGTSIIEWLVRAGKASLLDVPEAQLTKRDGSIGPQSERQRRQISCTRSGDTWRSAELKAKVEAVTYPIHFVDFEASRLALPYHARMRPYGQVAFQWSSHTVEAQGAIPVHSEWLNADDRWPNAEFVRTLRHAIGDRGSVVTWSSFERSTLREVASELARFDLGDAELKGWIADVCDRRIVDMHEWAEKDYYHPGMRGRTSIKVVLDALWKCDETMRSRFESWTGMPADPATDPYASLPGLEINGVPQDVREGTGAVRAYEAMMYGVERNDPVAKAQWRELLLQYCKLDTLSMILVFEHWKRAVALPG